MLLGLRNDVPELLQAMDIFLFPSLHEGFSVAFVEAQATGIKSVISSGVPLESVLIKENAEIISLKQTPKPVSYTHLDVYKRQLLFHAIT